MRREAHPDRLATVVRETDPAFGLPDELHFIPQEYGLSVSVFEPDYGYNPEAGITIGWTKLDEVIAALEMAKASAPGRDGEA